jgi:hypothetical protein
MAAPTLVGGHPTSKGSTPQQHIAVHTSAVMLLHVLVMTDIFPCIVGSRMRVGCKVHDMHCGNLPTFGSDVSLWQKRRFGSTSRYTILLKIDWSSAVTLQCKKLIVRPDSSIFGATSGGKMFLAMSPGHRQQCTLLMNKQPSTCSIAYSDLVVLSPGV